MGSIEKKLFFNAPVERVWKVWVDVEKTPEWVEGVQESRVTSPAREGKGFSWSEKCLFGKKLIQMEHEFSDWEPLKRSVIRTGLPMGGTMERACEFAPAAGGTEVSVHLEWDLGLVGAFFDEDKLAHMMEKSFDLTAEKWKTRAEASAA